MSIALEDINHCMSLTKNLANFPGLEKYQNDIQILVDNQDFANNMVGAAKDGAFVVEHASGLTRNILNPENEYYNDVKEYLSDSLSFAKRLLADKELMDKEPFLKAYVGNYKTILDRSFSDSLDANDIYSDNIMNITTIIKDQFDHLPTGEEYRQMTGTVKKTADKILGYLEANREYYDFKGQADRAIIERPAAFSEQKFKESQDMKLGKLHEAAIALSETSEAEMSEFFEKTNNNDELRTAMRLLYEDEKHTTKIAAQQLGERRLGVIKNLTPEESRQLDDYASQVKGIFGTASGLGASIDDLPDEFKKLAGEIKDLGKQCSDKLKEGFSSVSQKNEFFKDLGEKTAQFARKCEEASAPEQLSRSENMAMENIITALNINARYEEGALGKAVKQAENISNVDKVLDPGFKEQFKQCYEMMKKTGGGSFLHRNSKEYTDLMNTAKVVAELSDKEPLSDMQLKALGENYGKLSKVTQNYLTDRKIGNKSTQIGEDRFAGALGILNLVDPEKGEQIRERAQDIRGKEVSFNDIYKRAADKAPEMITPERTEPARTSKAKKDVVKDYFDLTDDWSNEIKKVDFSVGSKEFDSIKESLSNLSRYAVNATDDMQNLTMGQLLYIHELEEEVIKSMEAYLDHKQAQFDKDPKRRDDPSKQKREQPRIKTVTDLLKQVKDVHAERTGRVVNTVVEVNKNKLAGMLQAEEEKRAKEGIGKEEFRTSVYNSLNMINNMDGRKWEYKEGSSLSEFIKNVESMSNEKLYKADYKTAINDKTNVARNVLKNASELFKNSGEKLTNSQLQDRFANTKSGYKKDVAKFDVKQAKAKNAAENKKLKENLEAKQTRKAEVEAKTK
jgi:hypothetical protein